MKTRKVNFNGMDMEMMVIGTPELWEMIGTGGAQMIGRTAITKECGYAFPVVESQDTKMWFLYVS